MTVLGTCRETTKLASRALDERLSLRERWALWIHLAVCRNCARFNRQLQQMRRLFRMEAGDADNTPGLAPEARQRIETELRNRLDT